MGKGGEVEGKEGICAIVWGEGRGGEWKGFGPKMTEMENGIEEGEGEEEKKWKYCTKNNNK
jgi:hypothetical protein